MFTSTPDLAALHTHWKALSGDRPFPSRDQFAPEDVGKLLPRLALVEVGETLDRYRFRVWGSELVDFFGEDRTWRYFEELRYIENWEIVFQSYEEVASLGKPMFLSARQLSSEKKYQRYQRIILPLGTAINGVTHIVSGYAFHTSA